ncbi:MAG TPA: glycogen debranching protein GlgX [Rhizomicrobium sp.]|jgi:glycogen operon protein|nr:glycogen debranching protein GlgX [Rhizomicrobium sp.]
MPNLPERLEAGSPYPLGATWNGLGVNFTVFSRHATRLQLCIFDQSGRREVHRYDLPERTDEIWHGYLPDAMPGLTYGFRAHGPYEPQNGHRFNPHKLLLDPYAKGLLGTVKWTDAIYGYRANSPRGDLSFDRRDSAPAMVKGIVTHDTFDWGDDRRPNTPWSDTVIYEAHPRGLTKLLHDARPPDRGRFSGLAHPTVIEHLKRLGITTIELMPIHAFLQDRELLQKKLSNYWGYNTLGFFAIEPRYLATGEANEARMAIRRLHAAGIEVILDVVYNHTCETRETGPTICWRGLDNASYYRLRENEPRYYADDTGTGNTVNLSNPRVLQMAMDSLRYWARSFRIDGFRFDLGVTLGREFYGFDSGSGFFDALRQDPELSQLKLISEPWDLGPGGYQLGHHPPGFAEWNDKYRDTLRRYWRGDSGMRPEVARRLSGSADLFGMDGVRKPWASVNFVASHDGMTLQDLVSYSRKHNDPNKEGSADGASENWSNNWGEEGSSEDDRRVALRERVKRSMLVTLFAAVGTPMLLAGDECGRTQRGNNNPYCQDNDVSWFDWKLAREPEETALTEFVARLIAMRRDHRVFRPRNFLHGNRQIAPDVLDIDWLDERGKRLSPNDWGNGAGRALVMALAGEGAGQPELAAVLMNASENPLDYHLSGNFQWCVLIDSAAPEMMPQEIDGKTYRLQDRAAAIVITTLGSRKDQPQ